MHYLSADSEHSRNQASFGSARVLQWNRKCINIRIEGNAFFCAFCVHCVRWQIIRYCVCSVGFITALQPNPTFLCFKSKSDWMKLQIFANLFCNEITTSSDSTRLEHMLLFRFIRAGFMHSNLYCSESSTRWSLALGNISRQLFQKCNDLSICLRKTEF